MTAARDCKNTRLLTRLLVEVHPDTDLRRVSGIDGVLRMRPQAASRERVVWLKPEHSLKAREAALLHHGRVMIASPKYFGLVVRPVQERSACAARSRSSCGPKDHPTADFVAALNNSGLACATQTVPSTGKTWCVKLTS